MAVPVSTTSPIPGDDTHAMAALAWEWICWLKEWRARHEEGELTLTSREEREIERYFDGFRHEGGFISVAEDYSGMPGDARVDFIYIPTVTAISIQNLVGLTVGRRSWTIKMEKTLAAACGRRLLGHGYDGERYMAYMLEILAYGKILSSHVEAQLRSSALDRSLIRCYRILTRAIIEPLAENAWGRIDEDWATYCLKLMNCDANNWELLTNSPLIAEFERELKPGISVEELLQRQLFDE